MTDLRDLIEAPCDRCGGIINLLRDLWVRNGKNPMHLTCLWGAS